MPKCVVSGYIGFDNFGDEAIAQVLSNKLKKEGYEVTLISSNPQKTSALYNVKSCGMFKFIPSMISSDKLVSGGGSLLQDVTSLKSLLYYLAVIYSALFLRKNVEVFAQGIGPINSKIGQILTKHALKKVSKISVRDKKSQELLASWGIKSELVQDPVFNIEIPQTDKKNVLGVQLREFEGVTDSFLQKLAEQIKKTFPNTKIEVLSLQDSIDLDVCKKFAKLVNGEIYFGMRVNEVIERISTLKYLIGMRFHANVIGIKSGVKTLAVNYDPKVEKLAKEYNLPIIKLDQEDFSSEFSQLLN